MADPADGRARRLSRRALGLGLLVLVFLRGLSSARYTLFSGFANYDDEGYLLITLRQFEATGGLYGETYSHYGPFFYLYRHVFHGLSSLPITHDVTRWLTVGEWGLASLAAGAFVFQK